MKRKWFSVEQIVAVLKQAELGLPVADLARQTGINEQTFYRWKKQFAELESTQVTLPPQQMLGASLGYTVNDKFKLEVHLANLTNQQNWTSNGALYHGEPRTISASANFKF